MIALTSYLRELKLDGVRSCLENLISEGEADLAVLRPVLQRLFEAEVEERKIAKANRLLKQARFRYEAGIASLKVGASRNISKEDVQRLAQFRWVARGQNLLITGPTGAGKSYLASALGRQSCQHGYKTLYFNSNKLWLSLIQAKKREKYSKELSKLSKVELLILDDFRLTKLDSESRLFFFDILEERWGRASTMVISQRPFASWHELLGEPTVADAICDRLFANSEKIELKGESLRQMADIS